MNPRKSVSAADLFVLLDREFRRRRPRECHDCFVSLPYRVDVRGEGGGNWELVIPTMCDHACALVVEEMVSEFRAMYDLKAEAEA
jgi:hypothetical protein